MSHTHGGSCLCGAITYRISGPMRAVVFCHCSQCRKQTGLYYASTNVADADIAIEGIDSLTWYQSSDQGRRGFCKRCGSALFWKYLGVDQISIQAGSLDQPTELVPGYHIFCADKGDFYAIQDGLPQFAKDSPAIVTNTD
jgi:hypothetical protein